MVCTGAKSEEDSELACKQYAKMVRKTLDNKSVKLTDFKVQNIVASVASGFNIKLEDLKNATQKLNNGISINAKNRKKAVSTYEPEVFPGLIFRMEDPKVVMLIFTSGKIVLTGAKTRQEINDAYKSIFPTLRVHENTHKNDPPQMPLPLPNHPSPSQYTFYKRPINIHASLLPKTK